MMSLSFDSQNEEMFPETVRFESVAKLRDSIFKGGLNKYILINVTGREVSLYPQALKRMVRVAEDSDAGITYSYYRDIMPDGSLRDHPVNDYQIGSLRDNFDFGSLVLLNVADVLAATEDFDIDGYDDSGMPDGGWYAMRLRLAVSRPVCCIPEYLYASPVTDTRASGQRQHDYVDRSQASYQKAMEKVLTEHLDDIGGLLSDPPKSPDLSAGTFPVTASVIIPVRNRVKTIASAVTSALSQLAAFDYNVIVVDNGSTDGTSRVLTTFEDPRLHVISLTGHEGLGIGGCWNQALLSPFCGRFSVQLDSDDVYSGADTLQRIVDCFYATEAGMVVGSYTLTDASLNPLGRGVVDHAEWTEANGRNNALRINGFGAPRAFLTALAREYLFPNVSYGEDYAMCLRISREWKVGRIFDSLYNCRRWDGNSDASLSVEKENQHDSYKDFVRTVELLARLDLMKESSDLKASPL